MSLIEQLLIVRRPIPEVRMSSNLMPEAATALDLGM